MVITDPALISLLRSATTPDVAARPDAAEFQDEQAEEVASAQTQIAAVEPGQKQTQKRAAQNQSAAAATLASQSQVANSGQAAAVDSAPGASELPVDPQQAIKLIVQSLGVSSKLLDQLTAALGGSSEPVPPSAPLPAQIDTTNLEASTIELLLQAAPIPTISGSADGEEAGYESKLAQAGEKLARQILSALRPLAQPVSTQPQPTSQSRLEGSLGAEPNSTAAIETTELAAELSNLLQTTLWLSTLDQGELASASGPKADDALALPKLPPGDAISRLLTVLQLTSATDPNLLQTDTGAKSALTSALTGELGGLPISDSSRVTVEAAALLADPEAAELASTISRSIETVTRLLERVAPAETENLRLALRDLGASVARLTPPPALNPSSVRQPPPETVRTDVARAILTVRLEIDRLTNPVNSQLAQLPADFVTETDLNQTLLSTPQTTAARAVSPQTTATQVAATQATGTRLAELVSTVEKKGLELVLHQIAALSGHEQEIGALQRALEQDSLAATTLQTVRLLEKSLGSTDNRGTSRPELSDLRAGLKTVESILVDSLASGAALSTEKIDLALERLSTLLPSRAATAATDQIRFAQLTKLETALGSLLDQQLTGLKLLAPAALPLSSAISLGNFPTIPGSPFEPQTTEVELVNQLNLLTKIEVPKLDLLKTLTPLLDTIAQKASQQGQSPGLNPSNVQTQPANSTVDTQSANAQSSGPSASSAQAKIEQQASRVTEQATNLQRTLPQSQNFQPLPLRAQNSAFSTPTVQGEQVNALAKSIGLQLDLLSESLGLEDGATSTSVIARSIFSSVAAGSGRGLNENSASGTSAQALNSSGALSRQSAAEDATDSASSILGSRMDSILGRIDQMRRMIDDEGSGGVKASEGKLLDALHQTARRLQERATNREQPLAAADLQQAVGQLEELFRDVSGATKMPAGHQAVAEAIRQIETMIRGQEALSYLNPVMRALGEPTFILFPAVLHGMMVRVELLLYPNVDPDAHSPKRDRGNRGKKDGEESDTSGDGKDAERRRQEAERHSYHRLKVSLTLPNLGPIAVDFAHTLEEALLAVSVPDADAAAAVDSALPELRRTFNGLGYKTVEMAVKGDAILDLQPSWLQELLRLNAITA